MTDTTGNYLVSSYWRGSLNVKNMRMFSNLAAAVAYALSLDDHDDDTSGYFSAFVRVYEIFPDKPPVQIRKYK